MATDPAAKELIEALSKITARDYQGRVRGADFVAAVNAMERFFAAPKQKKPRKIRGDNR